MNAPSAPSDKFARASVRLTPGSWCEPISKEALAGGEEYHNAHQSTVVTFGMV